MLRKLNKDEYKDEYMQYLDSAYELALDMGRSCYPTYADGLKTRRDFDEHAARPFERDNYTMLLYEQDGEAVEALEGLGLIRDETSLVGVMRFEDYEPLPETAETVRVTRENFSCFARLHAQWDGQMYWDNEHLLEALDDWHIYYVQRDGRAVGGIYFTYAESSMEIFGVDFEDGRFSEADFRALMVRALNRSKADGMKDLTFFHDDEAHAAAESVGIRTIDTYLGYSGVI